MSIKAELFICIFVPCKKASIINHPHRININLSTLDVFFSIILNKLDFDPKYFWAWTDFQSYLDFMLAIWLVGAILTYFMLPFTFFMESVGFMAVFIEAMLGKRFWFIANGNHFFASYKNDHVLFLFNLIYFWKTDCFD